MSLLIRLCVPAAIQDHFGAHPILASEWNVNGPYSHRYFICLLTSSNDEPHATVSQSPSSIYRVSQEERTKLPEGVPYVKLYRYNPKHLYPKLNGYGDNGQRKVWTSCISA